MTKSRGVYVPRGTRQKWASEHDGQHECACGCGDPVPVTTHHYPDVPRFRHGHNTRLKHPTGLTVSRADWAAAQQGKHNCSCGCGEAIRVLVSHHSTGIPRYLVGHGPRHRAEPKRARECACGCQSLTNPGRAYVHGHNGRLPPLRDALLLRTTPTDSNDCWLWDGEINDKGYAVLRHNQRHHRAARLSYKFFRGPIPSGTEIDHVCRNRICVNPWHLDAVPHAENLRRTKLSAAEHRALGVAPPPGWEP